MITTKMQIRIEHPDQPELHQLIEELDAYQKPLYPPESHHGIDLEALSRANVVFAVIRSGAGTAIGCGAVVVGGQEGELKRMYIRPGHREQGLGGRLLQFLETEARRQGCEVLRLETGIRQLAAIRLYERRGYRKCPPFGDYREDPMSVFLEKIISST